MTKVQIIPERSGTAFRLERGKRRVVIDPRGEQVPSLLTFASDGIGEVISSNRSLDYCDKIYLSVGNGLYSNSLRVMPATISQLRSIVS